MRHTKLNSKWIKYLNVKPKPTKRKLRGNPQAISLGKDFVGITPEARIDKWGCVNLTGCYTAKETINEVKIRPWNG
jgi:hypothetical protein